MLALRLARIEFAAGIAGLRLFVACLGIGTLMLAAVWMLGAVLAGAFDVNGRLILGGDAEISDVSSPLAPGIIDALSRRGVLSSVVDLRSAARTADRSAPIELRAVDSAYPLYGRLGTEGERLPEALDVRDDRHGALVQPTLLTRLGLSVGDEMNIGNIKVEVRGVITAEPDRLGAGGFMIGPRVIVSRSTLEVSGLLTLGSIVEYRYRIRLDDGVSPEAFRVEVQRLAPDGGWRLRLPADTAGRIRRIVDRTSTFLGIAGVVALAIALSGAWAAASAWIRKRSRTIALYRLSGADPALVAMQHGLILGAAASVGIVLGILAATVIVIAAADMIAEMLPVPMTVAALAPPVLAAAGTMFLGVAGAVIPAVTAASRISAGLSMRSGETTPRPDPGSLAAGILLIVLAAGVAILRLPVTAIALRAGFWLVAAAASLTIAGWLLAFLISRLQPKGFASSIVVRSLSNPMTSAAKALAIGIGIAGITVIMSLQASIGGVMRSELSDQIPDLVLLDIRGTQLPDLRRKAQATPGLGHLDAVPHLRTIIKRVNGKPASDALVNPRRSRLVEGDIGLSWTAEPIEANLLAGKWWSPDYTGPTLISIEEDVADAFGIGPGDRIAFSVMGRDIEGEVANIREEKDRDFRIDFLLVTSPDPLRSAPHMWVGTIHGEDEALASFMREIGMTAPNITPIDVRQIVRDITAAIDGGMLGILAVASVLLVLGGLSLSAVVAADTDARARESLVFSLVGASRREIALARLMEIAATGFIAALIGGAAGLIGGWWLVSDAMRIPWEPGMSPFVIPVVLGALVSVVAGLSAGIGSLPRGRGEIARSLSA